LDKIKELYEEEFAALANKTFPPIEIPKEEFVPNNLEFVINDEFNSDPEFQTWKNRNTCEQKQSGYLNVQIKLALGDITSDKARTVANMASNLAGGIIVNTVNQNMMIPWVKNEALSTFY